MLAASFRLRLHQAIAAIAAIILISVAFAFIGAREIDRSALRSRNAQATLAAHITISNSAYKLFKQMSDAARSSLPAESGWKPRLTAILRRDIASARRLIADEVREFGASEDEAQELENLASIEREIDAIIMEFERIEKAWKLSGDPPAADEIARLLDTRIDLTFNKLVTAAIAEERREVQDAEARLVAVSRQIRWAAIGVALLTVPLIAFVFFFVNRTLLGSLGALSKGAAAFAEGDLEHQIPSLASEEFELLRKSFIRMASDLSASRKTLHAANEGLEKEVADRTLELAEANRLLEEADASRRQFFADVSHELRTPLTVIRGEAEIALRGGERRAVEYREALGRIVEQASQIGRLVEDLLFIARADAGEPRMEMRSVAIDALLAEAAANFEAVAAASGKRLRRTGADHGAVVVGDRGRLFQVIGVLVDNGIQYSRDGGEVRLSAEVSEGLATIIVEDDGIGIPVGEFDRVFDRFYRSDIARSHSGGGMGLGLSVAKAIIEAHKGHIRLAASASGGVRASIMLPIEAKLRAIS